MGDVQVMARRNRGAIEDRKRSFVAQDRSIEPAERTISQRRHSRLLGMKAYTVHLARHARYSGRRHQPEGRLVQEDAISCKSLQHSAGTLGNTANRDRVPTGPRRQIANGFCLGALGGPLAQQPRV